VIANVGYLVAGVYHPGDSLIVPPVAISTLFAPINAPWSKISEVIDFVVSVRRRPCSPDPRRADQFLRSGHHRAAHHSHRRTIRLPSTPIWKRTQNRRRVKKGSFMTNPVPASCSRHLIWGFTTLPNRVLMGSMHVSLEDSSKNFPRLARVLCGARTWRRRAHRHRWLRRRTGPAGCCRWPARSPIRARAAAHRTINRRGARQRRAYRTATAACR